MNRNNSLNNDARDQKHTLNELFKFGNGEKEIPFL